MRSLSSWNIACAFIALLTILAPLAALDGVIAANPGAPTPPRDVVATPSDGTIHLTWSAPESPGTSVITNYNISRGATPGGETFLISLGDVSEYTDTGLTNGLGYYYVITAVNTEGQSDPSAEVSAVPVTSPSSVESLQATAGDTSVRLTWSAPLDDGGSSVTSYNIYRSNDEVRPSGTLTSATGTSYDDTALTNGVVYHYWVSAVNAVGEGTMSAMVSSTPQTTPGAPQGLTAELGTGRVYLNWTAPSDFGGGTITGYKVYRGTDSANLALLTTQAGTGTSYVDTTVQGGRTYWYQVSALNPAEGANSAAASVSVPLVPPSAPRNVNAVAGNSYVRISWSAPATGTGAPTYHLFRDGAVRWSGTATSYNDTAVINGVSYNYTIAASNGGGWGPNSTKVTATPTPVPTPPGQPRSLTVVITDGKVGLSWAPPEQSGSSPIIEYRVFRGVTNGAMGQIVSVTGTDYLDSNVTEGMTYLYQVSAVNAVGQGNRSSTVTITMSTPSVPSAPLDLTVRKNGGIVILTWTAPSDDGGSPITGYKVLRGLTPYSLKPVATVNTTSFQDSDLPTGKTYFYAVVAVNLVGEGEKSTVMEMAMRDAAAYPSASWDAASVTGLIIIGVAAVALMVWISRRYQG
jgi:fibronectin type 3 domain-containing protein